MEIAVFAFFCNDSEHQNEKKLSQQDLFGHWQTLFFNVMF